MAAAYILPFVFYLLGTAVVARWGDSYPLGYAIVVILGSAITSWLLWGRGIIRPHRKIGAGVVVGVLGIGLWIGLAELGWEQWLGSYLPEWMRPQPRRAFDPTAAFADPLAFWGFVLVRMVGLAGLVPVAEELFWRGFLARWLKSPDWDTVALGEFSRTSFLLVVLLFALAHPEWLAAAVYCALLNGLLVWKRDLWICIVAHAVSNLLLGLYVLSTRAWWLW